MMTKGGTFARLLKAGAGLWIVLSLAGLAGMLYTLWWQRDLVLYAGKSPAEQRVEVFRRAGLNPALLDETKMLARAWPEHVSYSLAGGGENQSYIKYLLAPRIPSGDARRAAVIVGNRIEFTSPPGETGGAPSDGGNWRPGWMLSLAIILALGYLLSRFLPRAGLSVPEMAGLAMLVMSGALTVSKALTGSVVHGAAAVTALGALGAALLAGTIARVLRSGIGTLPRGPGRGLAGKPSWLFACTAVIATGVLLSFMLSVIVVPDDWDAWAIWGAKAKVLALGSGPLSDVTWFGHADYPLLWPCLWAFSALCSGGWEEQLCRGWGAVFLLLTAWQIGAVTARRGGSPATGLFAAALFVSIPKVVVVSSWSYAEGPLWLLSVCCLGRILESAEETSGWENPLLAGLFAAAAAYAKNDGLLLAVLGFGWLLIFCQRGRKLRPALVYAAVFVAWYSPWFLWTRLDLHLSSHATEGLSPSAALVSHAWGRLPPAAAAVGRMWADFRQWSVVPLIVIAGGFAALRAGERRSRAAALLPLVELLVFFSIVVLHRADVTWQVSTSWDRLTIQALTLAIPAVAPALHRCAVDWGGRSTDVPVAEKAGTGS